MNQPVTRYAPYLWLVYLGALVFQPAFDPDTTTADWVATGGDGRGLPAPVPGQLG